MIEESQPSFYDGVSDVDLGAAVRKLQKQNQSTLIATCLAQQAALSIVQLAHEVNSTKTVVVVSGVTLGDENIGEWEIVCRRIKRAEEPSECEY